MDTKPSNIPADTILENLLDGVLIVDTYGYILYANKSAEELFRKSSQYLVGQNFGFAVTPYEIQEIEVRHGKKAVSVQLLASIIKWENKNVFLMTLRDVTERKRLEEDVRNANEELRKAERELKKLNADLEQKVELRTAELEKKNKDLEVYSKQLKTTYEETEMKVKFRNLELERQIQELKMKIENLRK
jgi:transcriptional regulator with PAS, ATPase and Fis domain